VDEDEGVVLQVNVILEDEEHNQASHDHDKECPGNTDLSKHSPLAYTVEDEFQYYDKIKEEADDERSEAPSMEDDLSESRIGEAAEAES
jgi:hypothetical protein